MNSDVLKDSSLPLSLPPGTPRLIQTLQPYRNRDLFSYLHERIIISSQLGAIKKSVLAIIKEKKLNYI